MKRAAKVIGIIAIIFLVVAGILFDLDYFGGRDHRYEGDAKRISSLHAVLVQFEIQKEVAGLSTYENFCSSKVVQGVLTSYSSIECFATTTAWAAGSILPVRGTYYCVDSTGNTSTTIRGLEPGETVCPAKQSS